MPVPALRRLVPAAGVALAVAVLGFGVVGVAVAGTADDGLPERFQLARPHGGDRGVFHIVEDYRTEEGMQHDEAEDRFVWFDEQPFFDGRDGTWHAAHGRLLESHYTIELPDGEQAYWWITWHATKTGLAIGQTGWAGLTGFLVGFNVAPTIPLSTSQDTTASRTGTTWTDPHECSLAAQLAKGVRLDAPIVLPDHCAEDGEPVETYTASRSSVGGVAAVRFERTYVEDGADVRFTVDYAEGIPEPLREQWTYTIDGALDYDYVATLTGFEVGTGAWDTGLALPAAIDLPDVTLAPRDQWGPSEEGVAHPFPASEAWAAARDDPTYTEFRDYLAAHPDAAAATGEYFEEYEGNQTHRTWMFLVKPDPSGPEGGYFVSVTQTTGPAGAGAADLLGLPAQAPAPMTTYDVVGIESDFSPLSDPLPDALPTVASVMARWQAHLGTGELANGWSFWEDEVSAGQVGVELPTPRAQDLPTGSQRDGVATFVHLSVGADGVPVALVEETHSARRAHETLDTVAPNGVPPAKGDEPGSALAFAGVGWAPPSGPVATGAAAISLLAGLVYWLWPAIKGGATGLFSRIETPRLLQHPLRRAITDAVDAQPGIHYQAILRTVGGGNGAVDHHLRKLVAAGLLVRHQGPGFTCYFPPSVDRRLTAAAGILKSDGARRVLAAVQARPGLSSVDLAALTELDPSTVSHHVHRLVSAGVLQTTKVGRTLAIQPTAIAQQVAAAGA